MAHCWEIRGCDGPENCYDWCPHYELNGKCPVDCQFTFCERPTYKRATSIELILDPDVDRNAAIKEYCATCEFFIKHGPRLNKDEDASE